MQQTTTTAAFFQVAAALIPVLLLGGAITKVLPRPERWFDLSTGQWKYRGDLIGAVIFLFFVLVPLSAEGIAISNVLLPDPSDFDTWFVSLTLAGGTLALGITAAWPWMNRMTETNTGKRKWGTIVVLTILFLYAAYSTADNLQASVGVSKLFTPDNSDKTLEAADRLLAAQEKSLEAERIAGNITKAQYAKRKLSIAKSYQKLADNQLSALAAQLKTNGP